MMDTHNARSCCRFLLLMTRTTLNHLIPLFNELTTFIELLLYSVLYILQTSNPFPAIVNNGSVKL